MGKKVDKTKAYLLMAQGIQYNEVARLMNVRAETITKWGQSKEYEVFKADYDAELKQKTVDENIKVVVTHSQNIAVINQISSIVLDKVKEIIQAIAEMDITKLDELLKTLQVLGSHGNFQLKDKELDTIIEKIDKVNAEHQAELLKFKALLQGGGGNDQSSSSL